MITLTTLFICAIAPFILVFIFCRILFSFIEKGLDFLIEKVFSLPEQILDSIKEEFSTKKDEVKTKLIKADEKGK